ncbi:CBM35 domain-containing protein [Dyadobacter sp. 676]|uniref:CBM35 domain-containing protein n=1 Tax=Dyadobacter sp. 676 TaxID=3088362 RepID=A0AAU8FEY6_9BACT
MKKIFSMLEGTALHRPFGRTAGFCRATLHLCLLLFAYANASAQSYEAESGVLSNGADIQGCGSCSGGSQVGNLGNGAVVIPVNVAAAGTYNLTVTYSTGDPRTINVTPNGGTPVAVSCPASGGWATPAAITVSIVLNAGSNSIRLDNTYGYGPNIDKIAFSPANPPDIRSIAFGTNNRIDYDLANGHYSVYFNNSKVIGEATASANSDQVHESTDFTGRTYSTMPITDAFGSGTKHVITMTKSGAIGMQQIFYTYPGKEHFFTELVLTGNGSNCYKMTPLVSNYVDIQSNIDRRALFVPFDNDAWVRYDAKEVRYANFFSSEAGAIYDNASRKGLVIGSVEHSVWKTGVNLVGEGRSTTNYVAVVAGWTQESVTRDKRGHGWVSVGQTACRSPRIMVSYDADWRNGFEAYGQANALAEPRYVFNWTASTPFGWNSWGAIQSSINLPKARSVVDFFSTGAPGFRNSDSTLYIDLDSYWDNMSGGGLNGNFSELTEFAAYCKSKGFKPGIYWAPFVDWGKFARQMEGSSYNYQDAWTKVNGNPVELDGAYALDPTHPGTKARLQMVIGKFIACGFEMIKIDFLGHAALEADSYYDNTIHTGMEAYRKGMEYLIDQLDGKMLVYAAISPNLATGRYAHMRRIACDAYKDINETAYTLNSTTYGWWQKHIYNYLDADHLVFGSQTEGENRARLASGIVTGTLITGDDFSTTGTWTARAQALLQNEDLLNLAAGGTVFTPVEGNTGNQANEVFVRNAGNRSYLAIFNYGGTSKTFNIDLQRAGMSGTDNYTTRELFSGATGARQAATHVQGTFSITVPAADAAIVEFNDTALPVTFISFTAEKSNTGTLLQWKTAGETNNREFIIERSTDGKVFKAIGKVPGAGDSSVEKRYAYHDLAPVTGVINYYRLKQVDFDGHSEKSVVRQVNYRKADDTKSRINIYPNPGADELNIRLNQSLEGKVVVRLVDMNGKCMLSRSYTNPSEVISVPGIRPLRAGNYIVEVESADGLVQNTKFNKN